MPRYTAPCGAAIFFQTLEKIRLFFSKDWKTQNNPVPFCLFYGIRI
jgi:hypothetical protein